MQEVIKTQINEARIWIRDCSWIDEAEDLEDLTDEEVRRGIDRHYDGGWTQFLANCQFTSPRTVPFATSLGIPDDTVWDWIHVYKACLLEEILRGRGAAGEFRELICFTRNEYRDEYYQQLGWMWFGVSTSTLDEIDDEHETFFAHPVRCSDPIDLRTTPADVTVVY